MKHTHNLPVISPHIDTKCCHRKPTNISQQKNIIDCDIWWWRWWSGGDDDDDDDDNSK